MTLVEKLRSGARTIGYWVLSDNPQAVERVAGVGYDYVCFDAQHGLLDYRALLDGMTALDARGCAGLVRVQDNQQFWIGQALDAGATGVIIPMVNSADDARAAVAACRYPPAGRRSMGPVRAELRFPTRPAEADAAVLCLPMIETAEGLAAVEEIAAVPGVDGLYIGPSDLRLGLGGAAPDDPAYDDVFAQALERVRAACASAGIVAGIHTPSGAVAARRFAEGFSWCSVASDLTHLEEAARSHLGEAQG
ncbi:HpcH/HpaI aldolase family protein [Actinomycetospora termitidis]|uniref:Aldolase/citrate lyase family protein n=1 Tax=Actinomycetospora termitidis TaxID=3053470 RepID=A0ABT7M3E8_9PSEU|nr:aldolase/citrate lyase family protein [Actinomycetospora sp. Odt1-22]MDL5154527.1 aldolase/citrate lyase family protein [Actinomycetospora sp. Odt1-22]